MPWPRRRGPLTATPIGRQPNNRRAAHACQGQRRGQRPDRARSFFGFIPNIVGFLVILLIGWVIAKIVRTVVNKLLDKVGVDKALHSSSAGEYVEKVSPGAKPSHLIGAVAYWFIFLFALRPRSAR